MLFPAIRVDGAYYLDGGLRLSTPLAPAVHLGADRLLVIALRHGLSRGAGAESGATGRYANPLALYGKVLNALLLDHLDTDLGRLRLLNTVFKAGEDAFGRDFMSELNDAAKRSGLRHSSRLIDDLVLRPSQDLAALASDVLGTKRVRHRLPVSLRVPLDVLSGAGAPSNPTCSPTSSSTRTTPMH